MGGVERIAEVRLLGGVHAVASDGSVVDLPSASQRRLLAVLALHAPRRLRSEWLADLLGITPGALRTSVSRLRSAVGDSVLQTASTGYSLVSAVDATEFCRAVADAAESSDRIHALERALSVWTGPVLEEFEGEEWAAGEIGRITELHAGTVDDYAEELISARRSAEAVATLDRQVALHPYRDRSRGLLIRALASAGQQADALRAFHQYRSLLIEDLGTEPSAEVVRTERRVATGWDGIDEETESQTARDVVDIPLSSVLVQPSEFVGRAGELAALVSALERVSTSGLHSVVVGGEAGIGKSTLLSAFACAVAPTAVVVYGRCDETGISLQPFITILSECVEHAPLDLLTEHVARCGGELARMCPRLMTRVPSSPAPTRSDDETARFLTFEAATDLLRRIASARPVVLILDDLQWAEPTALLFLRHIARGLAGSAVLLVCSSRDLGDRQSDELRVAFSELERGHALRLQLEGFDAFELADLVSSATSSVPSHDEMRRVAEMLHDETAGNPLYASQLIRHWVESGRVVGDSEHVEAGSALMARPEALPPSLRDLVWLRVKALGDDAIDVLTTASVLGMEFWADVLVDAVDVGEAEVVEVLDTAVRAGLLVDGGNVRRSMRFVHALVASALYSELGPARRARIHGRAARTLEKQAETAPADVVVQLARHCALAGMASDAQRWSTRAGDDAFEHLAPTEAAQHYRTALDIAVALDRPDAERADLMVRLGAAQHRAGVAVALDTLEQGAELARRSGAHDALVNAVFAADRGFPRYDERAPNHLVIVEAAVAVADPADVPTYARLLALLAQALFSTNEVARRVALANEALELAQQERDATLLARIVPPVLYALWAPGSSELRSRVAAIGIAAAEATGDPRLEIAVHFAAYYVAIESADHVAAARSLAKVRAGVQSLGEPQLRYREGVADTLDAATAGRLTEAEARATEMLELGTQIAEPDAFSIFAGQFFMLRTFAGRHDELFPLVEQAARENPNLAPFAAAYGIISAAVGREDTAREVLHQHVASDFSDIPVDVFWITTVIGFAIIAIELADAEAAAKLFPLLEPFAAEVSNNGVTSQGPVAAYLGKLASLLGWHDVAEDNLRTALDIATRFGWHYHRATTLVALAQARVRRFGTLDAEGEAWVAEGAQMCRDGGYRYWLPLVEELEREAARAAGASSPR